MNKKNKGRYRDNGATPKQSLEQNDTAADPLMGWFGIIKPNRINRQLKRIPKNKGGWR